MAKKFNKNMEQKEALTEELTAQPQEELETKVSPLETFFRVHDYLVKHATMPLRRQLMDEINWEDRLIAIKGGRGVGKTDFLLGRVKEIEEEWRRKREAEEATSKRRSRKKKEVRPCLFVSMNDFYFTTHSLLELAGSFVKAGGQYLFIDQLFK